MTTRIVVLSDLHVSVPGPLNNFRAGEALADMIDATLDAGTTLVLAGDVFDFLQVPDRPETVLDLPAAPDLMRRTFAAIRAQPWGERLFTALGSKIAHGTQCLVLAGNHDPEVLHPSTEQVLGEALGLGGAHKNLCVHRDPGPWQASVGRWTVRIAHGHRGDPWNAIKTEDVQRAIATGDRALPMPPGSKLVTQALNAYKNAIEPVTGAPRFPFVDMLKPELPAVPLMLLYLDPAMARSTAWPVLGVRTRSFLRGLKMKLGRGPVFGAQDDADASSDPGEVLGAALAAGFTREDGTPDTIEEDVRAWLTQADEAVAGTLAHHGGLVRQRMRAWLRNASQDGNFFKLDHLADDDRQIVEAELPEGSGPRIVIAGHTHAAREVKLPGERVYLNTGTWTDLMKFPAQVDDAAVRSWIDALERREIPRIQRFTWAEVTPEGGMIRTWISSS